MRAAATSAELFEALLGAPPNLREYRLGDEEPPPLPDGLAERLAVDLGPAKA